MPRRSKVEELKNLLADNALSTLALVGSEEVSETVDGSANLEILRCAQDDKV